MTSTPLYSAVLLDLDGTVVDSAPGIMEALEFTLHELGLPHPSEDEIVHWIGPPILDAFRDQAGLDERESRRALSIYRRHYLSTSIFNAEVYAGMGDVIRSIHDAGLPLSLATSKPESSARIILDHLDLSRFFSFITGASEDESRSDKADVILEALRRLRMSGADLSAPIMIGDRHHDVNGALARGLPAIFCTWGYGMPEEKAGAIDVADSPAQLSELLGLSS